MLSRQTFRAVSALLLAAWLLPAAAAAQAQGRDIRLSGMGVRKCSDWQQWKETREDASRAMALEWAQGFIAGHNVYARSATAGTVVANVTVLTPLLDAYCSKNPEERILSGVVEITKGLGGAKVDLAPKPVPSAPRPEKPGRQES